MSEAALHSVLDHPNILTCYNWEMRQLGGQGGTPKVGRTPYILVL